MRLQEISARVDRMGVKAEERVAQAEEIRLAEMELSTGSKLVMLLGRLAPVKFVAPPDLIATAGRYLGV